ncbi:MAG: hypothetical protein R2706_06250 [Acidimicrobiales bacterium]
MSPVGTRPVLTIAVVRCGVGSADDRGANATDQVKDEVGVGLALADKV